MTHVITDKCIRCKYQDCVVYCPVECFHEGVNMLVINPDVCIDCGVCIEDCPVGAIIPDTDPQADQWVELNKEYSLKWPIITVKGIPPQDAAEWDDVENKLPFLDPRPVEQK
ncbi:MAG: ferredoxin [Candidatus Puniceispirillum sp.]|nr:ferredoxin [Candidatus Pelagibacter sp.]MBA4282988.1 ferredoxin [Candidatus Puniceispirillum sp.]